jgi:hypothetical protein
MRIRFLSTFAAMAVSLSIITPQLQAEEKLKQAKATVSNISQAGPVQAPAVSTDTNKAQRISNEQNAVQRGVDQATAKKYKPRAEPPSPTRIAPGKKTDKSSSGGASAGSKPSKKTDKPSRPPQHQR